MAKQRKLGFLATVSLAGALSFAGCAEDRNLQINSRISPQTDSCNVSIATVNGFLSAEPGSMIAQEGKKRKVHYKNVPVGFWQSLMPFVEEAYKNGDEILLVGYSSGGDQINSLAKACAARSISVRKMILIDPTDGTNLHGSKDIPSNVKGLELYFSSGQGFMGWARGNPNNYDTSLDSRIECKQISGDATHLDVPYKCSFKDNLKADLDRICK